MPPPIGKLDEPVDELVSLSVEPPPVTGIADGSSLVEPLLLVVELLFAAGLLVVVELLFSVVGFDVVELP